MLLFGFLMAAIIINVQVLARCTQRFVAQVVSDEPEIDLLIGHM